MTNPVTDAPFEADDDYLSVAMHWLNNTAYLPGARYKFAAEAAQLGILRELRIIAHHLAADREQGDHK